MYHTFKESKVDKIKCSICNIAESEHICVVCKHSLIQTIAGMPFCEPCAQKEIQLQEENARHERERIEATYTRPPLPEPDSTIQVQYDIFNAKIASIDEIRKSIEADDSIENKHFELANRLQARFEHLKSVIQAAQETIKESANESRAIQTYYNELAKKLKAEEREKIKLQDVKYTPPEKPTKPIKPVTVKKYNKSDIKDAAVKSGIPEMLIQLTCVSRKCTPIEAIAILREAGY